MEITNELLAAYAEGNVSDQERKAVRQYLAENPNEMETVLMMMDDDYGLELDDEVLDETAEEISLSDKDSFSDICYSAAAFAPKEIPISRADRGVEKVRKRSFQENLGDLLKELDL